MSYESQHQDSSSMLAFLHWFVVFRNKDLFLFQVFFKKWARSRKNQRQRQGTVRVVCLDKDIIDHLTAFPPPSRSCSSVFGTLERALKRSRGTVCFSGVKRPLDSVLQNEEFCLISKISYKIMVLERTICTDPSSSNKLHETPVLLSPKNYFSAFIIHSDTTDHSSRKTLYLSILLLP